jgi:V/A-type H+/Na+-transporting ATPase subunit I
MPIAKMDWLTIVGLAEERDAVIDAMMRMGAVDIDQSAKTRQMEGTTAKSAANSDPSVMINLDGLNLPLGDLPHLMSRLQLVIATCAKLRPARKTLFSAKREVSVQQFAVAVARQRELLADLNRFEEARRRIGEIDSQILRRLNTEAMLIPWVSLQIDLAHLRTEKTRSYLGSLRTRADLARLDEALADEAPESITQVLAADEGGLHVHVMTLQIRESMVLANLRRLNFTFLPVQDQPTTPAELIEKIRTELTELRLERDCESAEMLRIASHQVEFEIFHDHLKMLSDKQNVLHRLAGTRQTFYLEGWIPSRLTAPVTKALASRFTIAFDSRAALADENYPILLHNNKLIKPYEVVVEMFNPPLPSEVDPTPVLAPFYFLFFGMMLSDVGYGLLLTIICALALFKFKVKGRMRQTFKLFFQCGLSAIFWGLMFGGYFGDMVTVISSNRIVIPPILFDPLKNPTILMLVSVGFGIIHLFTGMATKMFILIRSGDWQGAVLDVVPWYLLILGLPLTIAGIGNPITSYLAIAGAAIIILFSARKSRNPFARIGQGLYTLYGITSYLGDILSYTRVLALVLATSVIAMVVNKIGFLGGPSIVGFIIFILVAILGHGINFALSVLSAYIHTSRLHFVEFFGKFYQGGGRLWKPQILTSNYIEIERSPAKTAHENVRLEDAKL